MNAEELSARLPLPFALLLHELATEAQPRLRLWAASELAEMVLRFVVAAGTAEHEVLPPQLVAEVSQHIEFPTLGRWMRMAKATASALPKDTQLPELRETTTQWLEVLGEPSQGPGESLLTLRNRLAHAGPMGAEEAQAMCNAWDARVLSLALASLAWLATTKLVAAHQHGSTLDLTGRSPTNDSSSSARPGGDCVLLIRGDRELKLGPLQQFDAANSTLNVYFRHAAPRLQYIQLGARTGMQDSDAETARYFRKRFLCGTPTPTSGYTVPDFETDFAKVAKRRIGREAELNSLVACVRNNRDRQLIWIWGPAGMGKSTLFAALQGALASEMPGLLLTLPRC